MTRTFANGRTIVHARDGLVDVAGPPDVCKTPSPAGPVPVPYVNVARTADLAQGARRTRIGGGSIALASSFLATSTGDEPGTAGGGIISSRIRGQLKWQSTSLDVKVEGRGVARFNDAVGHNGNTFNLAFIQTGTGWAYADDFVGACPICGRGPETHRVHETRDSRSRARELYEALQAAYAEYEGRIAERDALAAQVDELNRLRDAREAEMRAAMPAGPANAPEPPLSRQDRKELREMERPIRPLAAQMRTIDEQAGRIAVHKRETEHGGYMIGVMVCKSGQIFAAMSGRPLRGFKRVVEEQLHWTLCENNAQVGDYIAANPAITGDGQPVLDAWTDTARRNTNGEQFYNPPGSCAAAKLVTRNQGHIPQCMTEMFFSPRQRHRVHLRYRSYGLLYPFRVALYYLTHGKLGSADGTTERDFDPGETVPSCLTCQTLVPMTLCDHQERSCP